MNQFKRTIEEGKATQSWEPENRTSEDSPKKEAGSGETAEKQPHFPTDSLLQPKPQEWATPGASGRGGAGGHKKQGFVKSLFEKLLDTPHTFDTPSSQVTALPTAPKRRQI